MLLNTAVAKELRGRFLGHGSGSILEIQEAMNSAGWEPSCYKFELLVYAKIRDVVRRRA